MEGTSKALISYYKGKGQLKGTNISISDFLQSVRDNPEWRKKAEAVRAHEKGTPQYDAEKLSAPAAMLTGVFGDSKAKENLISYSGFIALDCDYVPDIEAKRARINALPFTYASFMSIGGRGLCVLVKIETSRFADAFFALEDYFLNELGIPVDAACKNINRIRFVSSDEQVYHNENATLFKKYLPAKKREKVNRPVGEYIHTSNDIDFVVQQIEERCVDLTNSYESWYRAGLALISEYGQGARDYFHRISQFHPDYSQEQTDRTFNFLVGYGSKEITIATFYYYAKEAGLQIMSPKTRQIARVAATYKRDKSTPESAIKHLETLEGITREESEDIVKQIFTKNVVDLQLYDTIYQEAAVHIQLKYDLRYNELTRFVEDRNGKNLEDRELNNIFFELMNMFNGKLKRAEFDTIIKSDVVPSYNPLREFFSANKYRTPTGCIDALADSITTDTGYVSVNEFDATYVRHFLKKFIIGLVASAHGQLCDLMIVLTGPQGTGKTQFWRRLLPAELRRFYAETKLDREKDDEILMCKKWLLMNDEFGGQTVKEAKKFKDLLSKEVFTVREPYGRATADLSRLGLICGTSNELDVLNDPTGNRRIIPINVLKIDHEAYNRVDKTDLLIEAYHLWRSGESQELTNADKERLNRATVSFEAVTDERDLVLKYFEAPTETEKGEFFSATDVKVYLERVSGQRLGSKKIAQELKRLTGQDSKTWRESRYKTRRGYMLIPLAVTPPLQ